MGHFKAGDTVFPKLDILLSDYVADSSRTWLEEFGTSVRTVSRAHSYAVEVGSCFYDSVYLRAATQEEVDEELEQLRGSVHARKFDV